MSELVARLENWARRRLVRQGRTPGLRTAKTTVAAVASFVIADALSTSPQPVLAPLTALLVVQLTLYESVTAGVARIGSVLAGVLVAVGVASFVGLTWWSLAIVVSVSLVIGRLLRLGPQLLEMPISAMLVLAVGGSEKFAYGRVYETLIGAAAGIAVNAVIAPPLYVQPAQDAIAELAQRMSWFLRRLADQLRAGWSREAADRMLNEARALGAEVARADRHLGRAEESARFNPRGGLAREAQPRLRVGLTALEHCHVTIRDLCRALLDRTYYVAPEEEETIYGEEIRSALAEVVTTAANAIEAVVPVTSAEVSAEVGRGDVETELEILSRQRDELSAVLLVDPLEDASAWQQHAALLTAVDRLRVETDAAVRPADAPWRPVPITDKQRQAVRRIVHERPQRREARRRSGRRRR